MNKKNIKSAFESMMFIWGEPLSAKEAGNVLGIDSDEALEIMRELAEEYEQEGRGIVIREVNGSFQYVTRESNADYIERLCTPVKIRRLSQSALEVLAIVAYRQPVTRAEIESIRGVRCDYTISSLLEKGMIEEKGRKDVVGRPRLFGTSDLFLEHFGISDLTELPEIVIEEDTPEGEIEA